MPDTPLHELDPRLQRQVDSARTALERGNAEYTLSITGEVLRRHPGCVPVRRLQRAAQMKLYQGKSKLFAKAMGGLTSAGALLSSSVQLKKDPVAVMDTAEKILASNPTNVAALRLLAQAAAAADFPGTAVLALEAARDQQPENLDTLLTLGEAYIAAGQPEEAIAVGNRLTKLRPGLQAGIDLVKHASVAQSMKRGKWEEEGSFREKLKDEKEAVSLEQAAKVVTAEEMTVRLVQEAYERFMREPDNINHIRTIVDGYRKLGDLDQALAWLAQARQTAAGQGDATLEKLESDLRLEQLARHAETARAAAAADPDNAELAATRAEVELQLTAARLAEARGLVERYPNDAGHRYEYGRLLHEAGDHEGAIAQFQSAQRSPKHRLPALVLLGACFEAKGQYDLAVEQWLAARSEMPTLDEAKKDLIYRLGSAFERMGDIEKAVAEFKQIYAQDIAFRDVSRRIDAHYQRLKSSASGGGVSPAAS